MHIYSECTYTLVIDVVAAAAEYGSSKIVLLALRAAAPLREICCRNHKGHLSCTKNIKNKHNMWICNKKNKKMDSLYEIGT